MEPKQIACVEIVFGKAKCSFVDISEKEKLDVVTIVFEISKSNVSLFVTLLLKKFYCSEKQI